MRANKAGEHQARVLQVDLGVAGLGLVAVAVAIATGVRAIHLGGSSAHSTVVAGQRLTYPVLNAAAVVVLLLAALGVAVAVVAVRLGLSEIRSQRRILALLPASGRLPGHPDVVVVDEPKPIAFCAGHVRPRVCLSTGALEILRSEELDAVLAHERHHRAARDPLRLAAARVLCGSLFFLPALRPITASYAAAIELDADRAALRANGGRRGPLAAALVALSASEDRAMVGIAPERVDHLTGELPAWRAPLALLTAALVTTCAVLIVDLGLARGASVHTTLNLPMLSSKPCVVILAAMPLLAGSTALVLIKRFAR
ncbi:MAG: M56 family metallopeptidase [Actinomycetota bacterium]|nr:M56 family metallopeptidase [Actinomycetota bacterium]